MNSHDNIVLTDHAIEQARFRCGMTEAELRTAVCLLEGYTPERKKEIWIPISGYKGQGTAVVKFDNGKHIVITVRDASQFTQCERANEPLKASLYETSKRKK